MTYAAVHANPLTGNPLRTRADVEKALLDLFAPLLPAFSEGSARVSLSATAAHFDQAAADLEGFARPLWGLAPYAAGGGDFAHWPLYAKGLANGTDPEHPEYWGKVTDRDQRMVELAALGFALRLVPQHLWEPLDERAKRNVATYLLEARPHEFADNNWKFFRVMIDLGLEQAGVAFDRTITEQYLQELESFYLGDGWYRDGNVPRVDHYIPFAMHFYGLIYAALASSDEERKHRFRDWARLFAPNIRHWFADDGGALVFGRSMTYRFACAGFWAALAFADEEALPWGEVKGYYLRHLRWWAKLPITDRSGVLTVGFGYANLLMSENYNSAGSPYWAFKAFLPLALPASHPFWTAEEAPAPVFSEPSPQPQPGMVMMHMPGNVVALSAGQENLQMRFGSEKYAKFAYSSRYAFSVESDERIFEGAALDGMLGFSDDGRHFRVRETNEDARIAGNLLYARWRPWSDVEVETWLLPASPWHVRVHRIRSPRPLSTAEGGFAIPRADAYRKLERVEERRGAAQVIGAADFSGIADLGSTIERRGIALKAPPNTNLLYPKTFVPQLRGEIPSGETVLLTAAVALTDRFDVAGIWKDLPTAPTIGELEAVMRRDGRRVGALAWRMGE
ncbi:DUF2264 domain-containing protein [Microvirga mediterraneensis]|uniref:DUF2264 domain-containing protein n=1 Tax=Microvirga mediterraneensis TaxID=2754695 RepID=A0A838BPC4_9HYPH|nr:DUF2264 domain-containing protein [Microvirga mediterraneensis]MBA1157584.1 DUF2264 domain-containing protein [Microvirga mediterraneensis]